MLPVYVLLRGERRTIRVGDRAFRLLSGPGEYTRETGLDDEGHYEGPFMAKMAEELAKTPNAVFFDVGGGIGLFSLMAHGFGVRQLHVFEPNDLALVFMKRNLSSVPHRLTRKFVGDRDDAQTVSLDGYHRATGAVPTHVKMDIEGHEIFCLKGMRELLERHRPVLFVEFHERIIKEELKLDPKVIDEFFATLAALDYEVQFNGHHHSMGTEWGFKYRYEWVPSKANQVNYAVYARPRSRAAAV